MGSCCGVMVEMRPLASTSFSGFTIKRTHSLSYKMTTLLSDSNIYEVLR